MFRVYNQEKVIIIQSIIRMYLNFNRYKKDKEFMILSKINRDRIKNIYPNIGVKVVNHVNINKIEYSDI